MASDNLGTAIDHQRALLKLAGDGDQAAWNTICKMLNDGRGLSTFPNGELNYTTLGYLPATISTASGITTVMQHVFKMPADGSAVQVNWYHAAWLVDAATGGQVDMEVSFDSGTTWKNAGQGELVAPVSAALFVGAASGSFRVPQSPFATQPAPGAVVMVRLRMTCFGASKSLQPIANTWLSAGPFFPYIWSQAI